MIFCFVMFYFEDEFEMLLLCISLDSDPALEGLDVIISRCYLISLGVQSNHSVRLMNQ
jgi:hypothetical protein